MSNRDTTDEQAAATAQDPTVDELAARAAAMRLEGEESHSPRSPGLTITIPNPFEDVPAAEADETMTTASPAPGGQHVAAAPALPQPPRFTGTTMQDRRASCANSVGWSVCDAGRGVCGVEDEAHGGAVRVLLAPHLVTEQQWIDYFKQANTPLHIDYASVDGAMKKLQMKTTWPEPESRMMNLQADLEAILDQFNLTEVALEHEQHRIVKYLADALAPASFKAVIATKLTLHENKKYKNEVVPFCSWVTQLMREFMTWEHAAQAAAGASTREEHHRSASRGVSGECGARGGRSHSESRGSGTSRSGSVGGGHRGRGSHHGPEDSLSSHRGSLRETPAAETRGPKASRGECLKCHSTEHQVRDCPGFLPGEASELLKALRERRDAARGATVRRFEVVDHEERLAVDQDVEADHGTVMAKVDGVAVKALLLDSGADTSLVARGVLDVLQSEGKVVDVKLVDGVLLNPVGGHEVDVHRKATFREVVLTTSAGPLMLRNLACYVEEDNASIELTVGRPIMNILGYSTDKLLVEARDTRPEWEVGEVKSEVCENEVFPTALQRVCRMQVVVDSEPQMTGEEAHDIDRHETRTALPTLHPTTIPEVIMYLEKKVEVATKMG